METFIRENGYDKNGVLQLDEFFSKCSESLDYEGTKASTVELEEYNKMKASVEEYHGFYIGRYELSYGGATKGQSKKCITI